MKLMHLMTESDYKTTKWIFIGANIHKNSFGLNTKLTFVQKLQVFLRENGNDIYQKCPLNIGFSRQ